MSTREAAVSGQFYPSEASQIREMVKEYNAVLKEYLKAHKEIEELRPKAAIVPHAGYIYSGFTANLAIRLLTESDIDNIVVIGPSHRVYLRGTSISMYDTYATPLGSLKIDKELTQILKDKFSLSFVPEAHHEHSTEVQMPFIKRYSPDLSVVELVYGEEDPKSLAKVIEYLLELPKTAVLISTDLSHFYDINKANHLDAICIDAVSKLDAHELHQGCEACGKIGIEAMLIAAKNKAFEPVILDYRTSAETSKDTSSVVGYMSAAFIKKKEDNVKDALLSLARASIADALDIRHTVDVSTLEKDHPWLKEKGASFVTLTTQNDHLRGCIGSLVPHRTLSDDIISNAKSAAMKDPRFTPLTDEEFKNVKVEVSILTTPEPLEYDSIDNLKSKIRVGIDGVVLKKGPYQATYLPQVWEDLSTFESFFTSLCQKAGMQTDCLEHKPEILTYQVKKYKEM